MSDRVVYHIVPDIRHVGRHWKLEKEGAQRHVLKLFLTKAEALHHAKELCMKHCPSQLIIHAVDGKFEEEFVY